MKGKAHQDRMWYLRHFYGRGGWHPPAQAGFKKWEACFERLLKDGMLERDGKYDLYRITDKGIDACGTLLSELRSR